MRVAIRILYWLVFLRVNFEREVRVWTTNELEFNVDCELADASNSRAFNLHI